MKKKILLIIIGDEILKAKVIDKQVEWLAKELRYHQLELDQVMIIKDDIDCIVECAKSAQKEFKLIVTSGGLGSTKDDLTKDAIALALNKKIRPDDRAKQMSSNPIYHDVPEDFFPLKNASGLAPGLAYINPIKELANIIILPGVPREFSQLFSTHFDPYSFGLREKNEIVNTLDCIVCKTFGIPEETIFTKVDSTLWDDLSEYGQVGSYPQAAGVDIHINFDYTNDNEKENILIGIKKRLERSELKKNIYYIGKIISLSELVKNICDEKKISLSIAESATAGLISHLLTQTSSASSYFIGSIVTYHEKTKINELNVKLETINEYGIVSNKVAEEMALGCAQKFKTHWAISITGIAGPSGGDDKNPVGTFCLGLSDGKKSWSVLKFSKGGTTQRNKHINSFANMALIYFITFIQDHRN